MKKAVSFALVFIIAVFSFVGCKGKKADEPLYYVVSKISHNYFYSTFTYSDDDRVVTERSFLADGDKPYYVKTTTYDKNGDEKIIKFEHILVPEISYDVTVKYIKNDGVVEQTEWISADGTTKSHTHFGYANQKMTEKQIFNGEHNEGETPTEKQLFDADGNMINKHIMNDDENYELTYSHEVDEKGRIEKTNCYRDGALVDVYSYEYTVVSNKSFSGIELE